MRARFRGVKSILDASIAHSRSLGVRCVTCEVTTTATGARRLYESAGFECWGRNPASLCVDGELVAADHFVLWL